MSIEHEDKTAVVSQVKVRLGCAVIGTDEAAKSIPLQRLPIVDIEWFENCRRHTYDQMLKGGGPLRSASYHLPSVTTYTGGDPFPFNCCNKGVGFLPKQEYLEKYIRFFEEVHEATRGRPWKDSLRERVEAARTFYLDRDAIDYRACATLEIFEKTTFSALQRRPYASLLFTGEAPAFRSFQLNTAVETIGQNDRRHTFIMLLRTLFESESFHIYQPQFPYAYVFWICEVKDKTPFRVKAQVDKVQYTTDSGALRWDADALEGIQAAPSLIQEYIREQVEEYARQRGFDVITKAVIQEAKDQFMVQQQDEAETQAPPITPYKSICVPLDNSDHSKRAADLAVALGKAFGAKLTGSHVYAAKMHEYRFKQMEYSLPEKYLEEKELEHQRRVHDSMISMGLRLISESYVAPIEKQCQAVGLDFESKTMDGKHHTEIVKDVRASDYDLVIMGVLGVGRGRDSQIGSVCERVAREVNRDLWIVKQLHNNGRRPGNTILVGIDGSPQAFGGLLRAVELAKRLEKTIECVAVYDPYLHYSVFSGLVGALSKEASKVFNFEEQNKLHEEIIDNGLAQIYQSHLNVAETLAAEQGVEVVKTLLDGKAFQKILDYARKTNPWLLVMGRLGVHSAQGDSGLGSNSENLLRMCPCDLLLTSGLAHPKVEVKAEETIRWTEEAEERMAGVPKAVLTVARSAIIRLAIEKGHSVITSGLVGEAMERYMPKHTGEAALKLAQAFAYDHAKERVVSICKSCGVAASESEPVKCGVCGATAFERLTSAMIEKVALNEGGIEVETAYDGRSLKWSLAARRALEDVEDKGQRQRAKARIEKSARSSKTTVITTEFCRQAIEEETGQPLRVLDEATAKASEDTLAATESSSHDQALTEPGASRASVESKYTWTEPAVARILRVPAGFMRSRAQGYVESLAAERGLSEIGLHLVEEGMEVSRKLMGEMLGGLTVKEADTGAPRCPMHEQVPEHGEVAAKGDDAKRMEMMNEVGLMSTLEGFRTGGQETSNGDRAS